MALGDPTGGPFRIPQSAWKWLPPWPARASRSGHGRCVAGRCSPSSSWSPRRLDVGDRAMDRTVRPEPAKPPPSAGRPRWPRVPDGSVLLARLGRVGSATFFPGCCTALAISLTRRFCGDRCGGHASGSWLACLVWLLRRLGRRRAIMRIGDIQLAFPFILLAIMFLVVLGSGVWNLIHGAGGRSVGDLRAHRSRRHALSPREGVRRGGASPGG